MTWLDLTLNREIIRLTQSGNGWIDVSYLSDYFLKMYPPLTLEENETPGLDRNRSVNVRAMHNTVQQNQACTVTQGKRGSQLNDDKWRAIYLHLPWIPLFHIACCCLLFYNRALVKLDNKEGCDRNLPKTHILSEGRAYNSARQNPSESEGLVCEAQCSHIVQQPIFTQSNTAVTKEGCECSKGGWCSK